MQTVENDDGFIYDEMNIKETILVGGDVNDNVRVMGYVWQMKHFQRCMRNFAMDDYFLGWKEISNKNEFD